MKSETNKGASADTAPLRCAVRLSFGVGTNAKAWIGRPEGWKKPRGEWLGANEWGQLLAPADTGATGKAIEKGWLPVCEAQLMNPPRLRGIKHEIGIQQGRFSRHGSATLRRAAELWRWTN